MFSSNQIFEISGSLDSLERTLRFAMEFHGVGKSGVRYQITEDGKYCLGWGDDEHWLNFPFDFDAHIVAEIIKQHIRKQPRKDSEWDWADGDTETGFLMKVIPETFSDECNGIKQPFFGIVSIEPFVEFYSK